MAQWVCEDCTTKYSVGAERCPECRSTAHHEEGEEMPKITRHGGPSNAAAAQSAGAADVTSEQATAEPAVDGEPLPPAVEGDTSEREDAGLQRPARSVSKADWVVFANQVNARGEVDDRDPDSLTKAELFEVYGEYGEA